MLPARCAPGAHKKVELLGNQGASGVLTAERGMGIPADEGDEAKIRVLVEAEEWGCGGFLGRAPVVESGRHKKKWSVRKWDWGRLVFRGC